MPIKRKNLILYPGSSLSSKEWLKIREEVLERDGHCCAFCKVPNHASVLRVKGAGFEHYVLLDTMKAHDAADGREIGSVSADKLPPDKLPAGKRTRIVLTVAHLDHNPGNNGVPGNRPNLKALCQKHHLEWDAPYHAGERAKTVQAKRDAERVAEFGPMLPLGLG
jgi:5-methylcytosine-specific restriction endonuclease McrA